MENNYKIIPNKNEILMICYGIYKNCVFHTKWKVHLIISKQHEIHDRNIPLRVVCFISIFDNKNIGCLHTRYDQEWNGHQWSQ